MAAACAIAFAVIGAKMADADRGNTGKFDQSKATSYGVTWRDYQRDPRLDGKPLPPEKNVADMVWGKVK